MESIEKLNAETLAAGHARKFQFTVLLSRGEAWLLFLDIALFLFLFLFLFLLLLQGVYTWIQAVSGCMQIGCTLHSVFFNWLLTSLYECAIVLMH